MRFCQVLPRVLVSPKHNRTPHMVRPRHHSHQQHHHHRIAHPLRPPSPRIDPSNLPLATITHSPQKPSQSSTALQSLPSQPPLPRTHTSSQTTSSNPATHHQTDQQHHVPPPPPWPWTRRKGVPLYHRAAADELPYTDSRGVGVNSALKAGRASLTGITRVPMGVGGP